MPLIITHTTVATYADQPGVEINKAEWNADHALGGSVEWGEITGTLSDQTDLQAALDDKQAKNLTVTTYTTDTTLALVDNGCYLAMNSATPIDLTVPPNGTVAFPVGSQIIVAQKGVGQVTVVPDSGVTVLDAGSLVSRTQNSTFSLVKESTNTWRIAGDLGAGGGGGAAWGDITGTLSNQTDLQAALDAKTSIGLSLALSIRSF